MSKLFLVVDDSRVVRRVETKILEDLGFKYVEAEDGKIAVDVCSKTMPDAILLDWNMPNMNGIEFLRVLRKMPGGQTPIVIFCTTESDMERIMEALQEGANEYVMKPFDSDILQIKLKQLGLL